MLLSDVVTRSKKIRARYHELELQHHGSKWTIGEDALAFLTDAGLVGRLTMAHQGRWPTDTESAEELKHKLGECIWWVLVLAERMQIDAETAVDAFLTKTEKQLNGSLLVTPQQSKARRAAGKNRSPTSATKRNKN